MDHIDPASLFRDHAPFVASFLAHLGVEPGDVEDAVQEVFLIVHRKGGYDEGAAKPRTWLAEIAVRIASHMRRARRRRAWQTADRDAGTSHAAPRDPRTPFEALDTAQSLERVGRAIATLSLEQRAVFVLFEIEGESCESIAAGLGTPVGTVYSRLHAARARFLQAHERLAAAPVSSADSTRPGMQVRDQLVQREVRS